MSLKRSLEHLIARALTPVLTPRVFIDDYNGITAHLETLALVFAIRKAYGHEIVLDWREFDALRVEDTTIGKVRILARIGAIRLHQCDEETFQTLGNKKIICRSEDGPAGVLDPIYMEVAKKVKIRSDLADQIIKAFDLISGSPVVGLHVRRGDFSLEGENNFDPTATMFPAVPLWWYEKVMGALLKKHKDLKFFMSANGDPSSYSGLRRNFDIMTLEIPSPYDWKGPGHWSEVHPVADLFALACCPIILATPVSNFSHWAANVLGRPSVALIPLKGASREQPLTAALSLYGKRLCTWRKVCRDEFNKGISRFDLDQLLCAPAQTDWLQEAKASF